MTQPGPLGKFCRVRGAAASPASPSHPNALTQVTYDLRAETRGATGARPRSLLLALHVARPRRLVMTAASAAIARSNLMNRATVVTGNVLRLFGNKNSRIRLRMFHFPRQSSLTSEGCNARHGVRYGCIQLQGMFGAPLGFIVAKMNEGSHHKTDIIKSSRSRTTADAEISKCLAQTTLWSSNTVSTYMCRTAVADDQAQHIVWPPPLHPR